MSAATFRITGTRATVEALADVSGPKLRSATRKAARAVMKPTLADAKANAPKFRGRLAGSLKIHDLVKVREGEVGVAIYPSNEFTYKMEGSGQRVFVTRSHKRAAAKKGKNLAVSFTSVWNYAHIIETGELRDGTHKHKASWFLKRALTSNAPRMIRDFANAIRAHVEASKKR